MNMTIVFTIFSVIVAVGIVAGLLFFIYRKKDEPTTKPVGGPIDKRSDGGPGEER